MRKLLFLLILVSIIALLSPKAAASLNQFAKSLAPCNKPISYRIEIVDNRFGLSRDKFLKNTQKAEAIWETAIGKDLFVYDPQGDLSINMVFDERQSKNNQINELENNLKEDEQNLKPQMAEYERRSAEFRQKVQALNSEIAKWNSQGGAPPEEYERLNKEQAALKEEAQELNDMAENLNLSADQFNSNVESLNNQINSFNSDLVLKPEEGLFLGSENKIEIYFYNGDTELIHTLAHEMGHAIGMQHIQDKKAIMYHQTTEAIIPTQADMQELKTVCKLDP